MRKWYQLSYKSLRKIVLSNQKERQVKEREMIAWMHFRSFNDAMKEIEPLFEKYKHLKLHRSKAFRAWYKYIIDFMLKYPDIYIMKIKETGEPYTPEADPRYDPNAPDWEEIEREYYGDYDPLYLYDDDDDLDDDDDDDDYNDHRPDLRQAAKKGFYMGLGFGAVNSILGGGNN